MSTPSEMAVGAPSFSGVNFVVSRAVWVASAALTAENRTATATADAAARSWARPVMAPAPVGSVMEVADRLDDQSVAAAVENAEHFAAAACVPVAAAAPGQRERAAEARVAAGRVVEPAGRVA